MRSSEKMQPTAHMSDKQTKHAGFRVQGSGVSLELKKWFFASDSGISRGKNLGHFAEFFGCRRGFLIFAVSVGVNHTLFFWGLGFWSFGWVGGCTDCACVVLGSQEELRGAIPNGHHYLHPIYNEQT